MTDINYYCTACMKKKPGQGYCPFCGFHDKNIVSKPHQLAPRTIIAGKYLIGNVIGEGGFGITYIGLDLQNGNMVALKEFFPNGFVMRESTLTSTVTPYMGEKEEFFKHGREQFMGEATKLAKFNNLAGIVCVYECLSENETVYIVMEYIDGQTFKQYLNSMNQALPANQVFMMMRPIMTSLAQMHAQGIIHRDISPDNIMISKAGYMKLIDFGAARDFQGLDEKSLSVLLKPGYAPIEQYSSKGNQGPWTDVYAMCATMYRAITGISPEESTERLQNDTLQRPSAFGINIDAAKEVALMKGMAVRYQERISSMEELLFELDRWEEPQQQEEIIMQPQGVEFLQSEEQYGGQQVEEHYQMNYYESDEKMPDFSDEGSFQMNSNQNDEAHNSAKKKLSTGAWVLIGIGIAAAVTIIALAIESASQPVSEWEALLNFAELLS